jgi:peptide/nickel transport system permease protein
MWLYTARRLILALVTLALAVSLLHVMIRAVPGDPAAIMLGPRATAEQREELRTRMGLDEPPWVQLGIYFSDLAQGDLGVDVKTGREVSAIVSEQMPYTLVLILTAIFWAAAIGIPLGCYSAVRRNTLIDRITGVLSVSVIAVPSFVMALYALLIFAVALDWLPATGAGEGLFNKHLILPSFAVGVSWVGYIARVVRASMLEVLGETHVRMNRAFGLPESRIVFRYALPLAILPTVTLIGVGMAYLLSAAVFAEIVFARPGIGALIVNAVGERNYPIVMGCVVVTTGLFVIATALADLINAMLDPRAREGI